MVKFKDIEDEEIYKLRKAGKTYEGITENLLKKGYDVTIARISSACKRIFRAKREKEPKAIYKQKTKSEVKDEEIYELRQKRLTYKAMEEHFREEGKEISSAIIYNRCQTIYRRKGEEKPKSKMKTRIEVSYKEIEEKRKEGLTYKDIADFFTAQGKAISTSTVGNICREMKIEKPEKKTKIKQEKGYMSEISDEEIYEQREKGLTYQAIAEYFTSQGKKISHQRIGQRCKRIYMNKEKKKETIESEKIGEQILKLKETKGATDAQVKQIADLYGVVLDKANKEENNSHDEH